MLQSEDQRPTIVGQATWSRWQKILEARAENRCLAVALFAGEQDHDRKGTSEQPCPLQSLEGKGTTGTDI